MEFHPKSDWSYSAGVAYISDDPEPMVLLVLENRGETPSRLSSNVVKQQRYWELPLGRFDLDHDRDLIDTAVRELREESGFVLDRSQLNHRMSKVFRMPSKRPGYLIHQDVFYLVIGRRPSTSELEPNVKGMAPEIENAALFPLSALHGNAPLAEGAFIARGHRMRLMQLLKRCQRMAVTRSESDHLLFLIRRLKGEISD